MKEGTIVTALLFLLPIVCGFITVKQDPQGIWWFVDNNDKQFLSLGVNAVTYYGDLCPPLGYSPYERTCEKIYNSSQAKWAAATTSRLLEWNFNTCAAWSDNNMESQTSLMYTEILGIGATAAAKDSFPDVFAQAFVDTAASVAKKLCAPRKDAANLIGYFSDNELHWPPTPLAYYLSLSKESEGRGAAIEHLKSRGKTIDSYDLKDEEAFAESVSERYFTVVEQAIRNEDPNHLILGAKFLDWNVAQLLPILKGSITGGKHVDVHSIDMYRLLPYYPNLLEFFNVTQVPWVVAEFAFRANDSGLPNTKGAGPKVATQADRAQQYALYVEQLFKLPFVIGSHWFKWVDEPKLGRFDGEDSNYGVVTVDDDIYQLLTNQMKITNGQAGKIHKP